MGLKIFVSSRFREFEELRAKIAEDRFSRRNDGSIVLTMLDHREGIADTNSPDIASKHGAKTSDLFILLLGESYVDHMDSLEEGERSYTHREYDSAIQAGLKIIVFPIGDSYCHPQKLSDNKTFRQFQEALLNKDDRNYTTAPPTPTQYNIDEMYRKIHLSFNEYMDNRARDEHNGQLTVGLGRHNTRFAGRAKEFEYIQKHFKASNAPLLINGIGGIGKSALVAEFVQRYSREYNYFGLVVALTSLKSTLYQQLKHRMQLKEYDNEEDNFQEAMRGLSLLKGSKLLVIDDIQDSENQLDIIETISTLSDNGFNLLFTSREEIEDIQSYHLDRLLARDAKKLFNSIYPVADEQILEEVLGYINYYALLVEKLAMTLKVRNNTFSIEALKDKFDSGEFSKVTIKTEKGKKESSNIGKLLDELFTFDDLDGEDVLLLKQLSVLPSIDIPFDRLALFLNKKGDEDFEDLLGFLSTKGWLYQHTNSYQLHQIIREYIWSSHRPKPDEIDGIVLFFANIIKNRDTQSLKLLREFIVYFEAITQTLSRLDIRFNDKIVQFFDNLGLVYYHLGEYKRAEPYLMKVLEVRRHIYSEEHPDTASSYNNLAALYYAMGEYEKAEPLYLKALEIGKRVLGEEHPDTAISYNNLAGLYDSMEAYEKAEPLHLKALEIREKLLGEEHPDTASSYNNLALLYDSMGAYEKAEPLYLKALEIWKRVLGEEHPDTASSYNNLAALYGSMGAYEKAEPLLLKALEIWKRVLGEEHPHTATGYSGLAGLYKSMGVYEKAEPLFLKALEIRERLLGEEHPDTQSSYKHLELLRKAMQDEVDKVEYVEKKAEETPSYSATSYTNLVKWAKNEPR